MKRAWSWWITILLVVTVGISLVFLRKTMNSDLQTIREYMPFGMIFPINPAAVQTVGDQVFVEHTFAYHANSSYFRGVFGVFSEISVDRKLNEIRFEKLHPPKWSDGTEYSLRDYRKAIEISFGGIHSPYRDSVVSIETSDDSVVVKLEAVPRNFEHLITIPDFSLFDVNSPSVEDMEQRSTGPYYYLGKAEKPEILRFRRNPHYPEALRANDIDELEYHSYNLSSLESLANRLDPLVDHFLYAFGYTVTDKIKAILESKKYRLSIFPSEWLLYFGFSPNSDREMRLAVGQFIDLNRERWLGRVPLSQPAFSFCPSDRSFGLSEDEYKSAHDGKTDFNQEFELGVLSYWLKDPLMASVVSDLKKAFPRLKVVEYERGRGWDAANKHDAYLTIVGMDPGDPLAHYSFQLGFAASMGMVTDSRELSEIGRLDDVEEFNARIKDIELKLAKSGALIPVGHFPGVVAVSPLFEPDEKIVWNWGIQPWAYRLK